jgi:hypothetical protein
MIGRPNAAGHFKERASASARALLMARYRRNTSVMRRAPVADTALDSGGMVAVAERGKGPA